MTKLIQHLRYALRQLRKSPGFTAVAVMTLALGIGATTAIYTVLYATFLAPMPYPNADQLVMVWSRIGEGRDAVSAADFLDWKRQSTVFQDLNAWSGGSFNLGNAQNPEQVDGHVITPGWFKMQGFHFFLGRDFLPEEAEPGKDHVVILMHNLWERLGANRNIVGQQIRMNRELYTVVGVLAPGVADRLPVKLSVPLAFQPDQINRNFRWLTVMGRLRSGISLARAQADMDLVTRNIGQDHPESNKSWGASVEPLRNDFIPRETLKTLWLLMGAVGGVLLIACVNVANLLMAKGTTRQREVAVRAALGATRRALFTQFLTESLALALLGAAVGIGVGEAIVKGLVAIMPPSTLPSEAEVGLHISSPILLFTLITTTLAAILFGCVPAWQASGANPNDALKEGGRAGTSGSVSQLRRTLVVIEFALALTLLSAAGLAIHSFWNLTQVDLGVRTDHILTFFLPVTEGRFSQPEQMVAFYRRLLEKVESIPGVSRAEATRGFEKAFSIVGQPLVDLSARPGAGFQMITPGHFQTFGIRVVKGRSFTEQDTAGTVPVAMVNETFVRRYLPALDPLAQRIAVNQTIPGVSRDGPPMELQIVGVFHNVRLGNLREDFPEIYVPFWQSPWPQAGMAVRTTGDPEAMTRSIAAAVSSLDSDLPLADVRTMDQIVSQSLAPDRFKTILYGIFAGFALLLAAIGIYGVMAFAVAQRTHEIGLRMALGAGRNKVLALILREGVILALAGLAVGFIGACLVGRTMKSLLYGVGTVDLTAFAAVASVLLSSAILACFIPARRASKVDPMVALRYE
jgi:putative ABC transport system permease protein